MRSARTRLSQLQTWWRQTWCRYQYGARQHGHLYVGVNRLSTFCPACSFESSGVELETRRVRTLWMWDKQRRRWMLRRRMLQRQAS